MARIPYGNVLVAYFVMGAVMFGGGAFDFEEVLVLKMIFSNENLELVNSIGSQFDIFGISPVLAVLSAVLRFITSMLDFIHWPVAVFYEAGAPKTLTVLLGGSLVLMFYVSAVNWLRGIA